MENNFEIKGLAAICQELERIAKICVKHYQTKCATSLRDNPIVVAPMQPGNHRTNSSVLGHFTILKQWVDRDGKRYHEIAVNPHVLRTLPNEDLVETIYHEVIHLHCAARGVRDTSSNGRHNNRFATAVNLSGVIEAYDTGTWIGYGTRLTREGKRWVHRVVQPRDSELSRILPKSNGKDAIRPKRVKLTCPDLECNTNAMVAAGQWHEGKINLACITHMRVLAKA